MASPSDRAAWLEARRSGIGASDAAAVLGLNPWKTPFAVWAEKVGAAPVDEAETEAQQMGHLLEPVVARLFEEDTGYKVVDLGAFEIQRHRMFPWLCATLDRVIVGVAGTDAVYQGRDRGILEIKTTGGHLRDAWGEEPPLWVQVQFQHQLACVEMEWGFASVLIGGQRRRHYEMRRNEDFIAEMLPRLEAFWQMVETKTPPPVDSSDATTAALKALFPAEVGGRTIFLPPSVVEADRALYGPPGEPDDAKVLALRQAALDVGIRPAVGVLEEMEQAEVNKIRLAMGDAETGRLPSGVVWTCKSVERKAYSVAARTSRELRRRVPK